MPLLIPNRPPSPLFTQQRRRNLHALAANEHEQAIQHDNPGTLRLYPLESNTNPAQAGRRAMPVNPLSHPRQQRGQGYTMAPPIMPPHNTLGQHIPPRAAQPSPMPHQVRPPGFNASAPPPEQPMPQEQAVAKFRRANQGLPDGVRYEPLDEDTLRLLRENGHLPEAPPAPAPTPMQAPMQAPVTAAPTPPSQEVTQSNKDITNIIEGIIQDERNAQIFYSHMATTAAGQAMAAAVTEIASDCHKHTQQLTQLLASHFGSGFTPIEAEINKGLDFEDALALALIEENKSLRVLAELMDTVSHAESEKIIQRIINKKVVNYNRLTSLRLLNG